MARRAELQITKASWVNISRLFRQAVERESSVDSPVLPDGKRVQEPEVCHPIQEHLRREEVADSSCANDAHRGVESSEEKSAQLGLR